MKLYDMIDEVIQNVPPGSGGQGIILYLLEHDVLEGINADFVAGMDLIALAVARHRIPDDLDVALRALK